jgi:hypothetical protein
MVDPTRVQLIDSCAPLKQRQTPDKSQWAVLNLQNRVAIDEKVTVVDLPRRST